MPDHPEITAWADDLPYSINKNKRWNIQQGIEQVFKDSIDDLQEEDFSLLALVHPDQNTVRGYKIEPLNKAKLFLSSKAETPVFVGKNTSAVPVHRFEPQDGVKFTIVSEDTCANRLRSYKTCKPDELILKNKNTQRQKMYENNWDEHYWGEDDWEEETFAEEDEEIFHESNLFMLNSFVLGDFCNLTDNHKGKQKKETLPERSCKVKKPRKGNLICLEDEEHRIINYHTNAKEYNERISNMLKLQYSEVKKKRGRQNGRKKAIEAEEDSEEDEVFHPQWTIVFLETEKTASNLERWEDITEDGSRRRTLHNSVLGIFIILEHDGDHTGYNRLKLVSLEKDIDSSIYEIFSESKTVADICLLAEHLLGGRIPQTSEEKTYTVMSKSAAFLELLSNKILGYQSEHFLNQKSSDAEKTCCQICFREDLLTASICGEYFCNFCWSAYLETQVMLWDDILTCPGYGCSAPVTIPTLTWFLSGNVLVNYVQSVLNRVVTTSFKFYKCPSEGCQRVVKLNGTKVENVQCRCGQNWCTSCHKPNHYPASCVENHEFMTFQQKLQEFSHLESKVEVRPCPKCGTLWEKMYGCNFMSCTRCSTGFCWGCGAEHTDHTGLCGKMKVPLEKVEILQFPTEDFSAKRIESFQLGLKLKGMRTHMREIHITKISHRFLAADKFWYWSTYQQLGEKIFDTERGALINQDISRAVTVCCRSRDLLLNSLLQRKNTSKSRKNNIRAAYMGMLFLDNMLYTTKVGKDWESVLAMIRFRTVLLEKRLRCI